MNLIFNLCKSTSLLFFTALISSCVVENSNVCARADGNCATVDLHPPSLLVSGRAIQFAGGCRVDGSTISVDFQADGQPTAGVSTDPLPCECAAGQIGCPAVTFDFIALGTDSLSFKTTITNPLGATGEDLKSQTTRVLYAGLSFPVSIPDNGSIAVAGFCSPDTASLVVKAPNGFAPASVTCSCSGSALSGCGTFTESTATLNQPLPFTTTVSSGGVSADFVSKLLVFNHAPVPQAVVGTVTLGSYAGSTLFGDPEGDLLAYTARLVGPSNEGLIPPNSYLSAVGLSINSTTGLISGTLNGYSGQQVIVTSWDPTGSNTHIDSFPVGITP